MNLVDSGRIVSGRKAPSLNERKASDSNPHGSQLLGLLLLVKQLLLIDLVHVLLEMLFLELFDELFLLKMEMMDK